MKGVLGKPFHLTFIGDILTIKREDKWMSRAETSQRVKIFKRWIKFSKSLFEILQTQIRFAYMNMTWYCMVSKSPGSSCIDAMVIGNPSISPRESQKNWPWIYNSVKSSLLSRQRHHLSSIVRYLRRENARIMIFFSILWWGNTGYALREE